MKRVAFGLLAAMFLSTESLAQDFSYHPPAQTPPIAPPDGGPHCNQTRPFTGFVGQKVVFQPKTSEFRRFGYDTYFLGQKHGQSPSYEKLAGQVATIVSIGPADDIGFQEVRLNLDKSGEVIRSSTRSVPTPNRYYRRANGSPPRSSSRAASQRTDHGQHSLRIFPTKTLSSISGSWYVGSLHGDAKSTRGRKQRFDRCGTRYQVGQEVLRLEAGNDAPSRATYGVHEFLAGYSRSLRGSSTRSGSKAWALAVLPQRELLSQIVPVG